MSIPSIAGDSSRNVAAVTQKRGYASHTPSMGASAGRLYLDERPIISGFRTATPSLYINDKLLEFPTFEPVENVLGRYCRDAFRRTGTSHAEQKGRYMASSILSGGIFEAVRHASRTRIPACTDAFAEQSQSRMELRTLSNAFLLRTRVEAPVGTTFCDETNPDRVGVIDLSLCCVFNSHCDRANWFALCSDGQHTKIVPLKREAITQIDSPRPSLFDCLVDYLRHLFQRIGSFVSATPIDTVEARELDRMEAAAERQFASPDNCDDGTGRAVFHGRSRGSTPNTLSASHHDRLKVVTPRETMIGLKRPAATIPDTPHRQQAEPKQKKYRGALSPLVATLPPGLGDLLIQMLA